MFYEYGILLPPSKSTGLFMDKKNDELLARIVVLERAVAKLRHQMEKLLAEDESKSPVGHSFHLSTIETRHRKGFKSAVAV